MEPDPAALWRGMKARLKGWWLYVLPLPLALDTLVSLWTGEIGAMLAAGAGYAALVVGAMIARRGFVNEAAFAARPHAAAPPPYKAVAGGTLGLATAFTAFAAAGHDPVTAIAFGAACAAGFFLSYGFDPRPVPAVLPADLGVTSEEIRAALEEAYAKLDGIEAARRDIRSPELRSRLSRIIAGARNVLASIEENPRSLRRARRFINVYLDGAKEVSEHYARAPAGADAHRLDDNFRRLLIDMEAVCEEQQRKLADNNLVDLDVQIEVLTTRLRREGVA